MIWGGLLPDIYLQRETELLPDGETGPMYYCQFRGGSTPTVYGGKASGQSEWPNGPSQLISDWLSLTHGRVTYPVLLVDLTEVTQKYENVKKEKRW